MKRNVSKHGESSQSSRTKSRKSYEVTNRRIARMEKLTTINLSKATLLQKIGTMLIGT
jgi:hypothetical protein